MSSDTITNISKEILAQQPDTSLDPAFRQDLLKRLLARFGNYARKRRHSLFARYRYVVMTAVSVLILVILGYQRTLRYQDLHIADSLVPVSSPASSVSGSEQSPSVSSSGIRPSTRTYSPQGRGGIFQMQADEEIVGSLDTVVPETKVQKNILTQYPRNEVLRDDLTDTEQQDFLRLYHTYLTQSQDDQGNNDVRTMLFVQDIREFLREEVEEEVILEYLMK